MYYSRRQGGGPERILNAPVSRQCTRFERHSVMALILAKRHEFIESARTATSVVSCDSVISSIWSMARCPSGSTPFSYRQLSWATDWRIREDTIRAVLIELDQFVLAVPGPG
jgi:hypothetical protein